MMKAHFKSRKGFFNEKGTRGKVRRRNNLIKEILKVALISSAALIISNTSGKLINKYIFPSYNTNPVVQCQAENEAVEEKLLEELIKYHGLEEEVDAKIEEMIGTPARKKLTERVISESTRFEDYFQEASKDLDESLLKSYAKDLIRGYTIKETSYLSFPFRLIAESPKGAKGVSQFREIAAKEMDLEILKDKHGVVYYDERIDPEDAIIASANYFKRHFQGDIIQGLACYNAGPGEVQKRVERKNTHKVSELFREGETREYVRDSLCIMKMAKNPERYGLEIEQKELFSERRKNAKEHVIERGDTLHAIIAMYDTTQKKVEEANPEIINWNMIPKGRTILVPPEETKSPY